MLAYFEGKAFLKAFAVAYLNEMGVNLNLKLKFAPPVSFKYATAVYGVRADLFTDEISLANSLRKEMETGRI